jgi:hypothetical protein
MLKNEPRRRLHRAFREITVSLNEILPILGVEDDVISSIAWSLDEIFEESMEGAAPVMLSEQDIEKLHPDMAHLLTRLDGYLARSPA